MSDSTIADIRAFTRFYTRQIGLLNEYVAQSRFGLAEGRVLYEIGQRGHTTGAELAVALQLDPAYLSRILQKFIGLELILLSPHPSDRRSNQIVLSRDGDAAVGDLDDLNDAAVLSILEPLAPEARTALVAAMQTIRRLLGDTAPPPPVILRPARLGDLGWLIHRQGLLYNRQFGWNAEFEALIARIYGGYETLPEPKSMWVAEQGGQIAGSIFVAPSEGVTDSAQLRMLYVEPSARGQGLGAALIGQAVGFARANGYRRMRLWTHTIQQAARRLYAAAGFTIVETMPEENFGVSMTGEIWEMTF